MTDDTPALDAITDHTSDDLEPLARNVQEWLRGRDALDPIYAGDDLVVYQNEKRWAELETDIAGDVLSRDAVRELLQPVQKAHRRAAADITGDDNLAITPDLSVVSADAITIL